jgi:hypothetical protein
MNDVEAMRDLLSRLDQIEGWAQLVEVMTPHQRQAMLETLQSHKS